MSKMKFRIISMIETNPFYAPEKANNGGGYSQPEIKILVNDTTMVTFSDMSCGEFGSRYFLTSDEWNGAWGSMLKDDEKYLSRDIPEEFFIFLERFLGKCVGAQVSLIK